MIDAETKWFHSLSQDLYGNEDEKDEEDDNTYNLPILVSSDIEEYKHEEDPEE